MHPQKFTWVLLSLVCLWCGRITAWAEQPRTYKSGDIVRVKYVGEIVTAVVTSTKIAGTLEVEFDWKGKKLAKSFPISLVENVDDLPAPTTPPAAAKPAGKSTSPPKTKASPGPATPLTEKKSNKKPAKTAGKSTSAKTPKKGDEPVDSTLPNEEDYELRTWTSADGKSKIEARFGGLNNGRVRLVKEDGKPVIIAIHQLQGEDQLVAMKHDNELKIKQMQQEPPARQPGEPVVASVEAVKASGPDWSGVQTVAPPARGTQRFPARSRYQCGGRVGDHGSPLCVCITLPIQERAANRPDSS